MEICEHQPQSYRISRPSSCSPLCWDELDNAQCQGSAQSAQFWTSEYSNVYIFYNLAIKSALDLGLEPRPLPW